MTDVARHLGVTRPALSRVLNGKAGISADMALRISEAFGGRVRIFVCGGAPLGIDTAKWFASVGIALWEGYGLTETSPVIALNTPLSQRMGAAGFPLPNVELKIAEDGELLVRGPAVFSGYWHKPSANAECFDAEGWFRTGDIGHLDLDGFLYITDRKKELLKTSGEMCIRDRA